jgi:siroheme synthase-like protein
MGSVDTTSQSAFPLFLRLEGRRVLVVGGGPVALEKARALHLVGARLHVVAPEVVFELRSLAESYAERPFEEGDVADAWLVVAAATAEVNRAVKVAADARHTFVVAVDDPDNGSAIGAAQLRRGGLTVAISSDGRAPALVALLRRALERVLPEDAAAWVALAERKRGSWKATGVPLADRRPLLLRALNALYESEGVSP